jgi:hypothetical protein
MTQMFFGASSLEYVDFGTSTSNVVNINNLFFLAYSLKEIVNLVIKCINSYKSKQYYACSNGNITKIKFNKLQNYSQYC